MRMHSNSIFITGGTSGIGRGLAEAFHRLGNQVIISGRRLDRLQSICAANPGMRHFPLDVRDPAAVREVASRVMVEFPRLNCLFNNAGIQNMIRIDGRLPLDEQAMLDEINTNLLSVLRVAGAFLPHLKKQQNAVLVNVTSGLAYVPIARVPFYCATKAAVHSLTLSLRHQLRDSGIKVIELVPPYVDTELGGPAKKAAASAGPRPMPLDAFITEIMKELAGDADEVAVGDAKKLVGASNLETVMKIFAGMNH